MDITEKITDYIKKPIVSKKRRDKRAKDFEEASKLGIDVEEYSLKREKDIEKRVRNAEEHKAKKLKDLAKYINKTSGVPGKRAPAPERGTGNWLVAHYPPSRKPGPPRNEENYLGIAGKSLVGGAAGAVGATIGGSAALVAGEKLKRFLNKRKRKNKQRQA